MTRFDLIFSNAALHWLDHHESLFPSLLEYHTPSTATLSALSLRSRHVSDGGYLAVQMPNNFDEPSHAEVFEILKCTPILIVRAFFAHV